MHKPVIKDDLFRAFKTAQDSDYQHRSVDEILSDAEVAVESFGTGLMADLRRDVAARLPLEKRWLHDLRDFYGSASNGTADHKENPMGEAPSKSNPPQVNLTRTKTNIAESKLSDLMLSTDDRNWGLKATPEPTFVVDPSADPKEALMVNGKPLVDQDSGAPLTRRDLADAEREEAENRAEAMQKRIDDQLVESKYNAACRDVIRSAVRLGTGILKGPIVTRQRRSAWVVSAEEKNWVQEEVDELRPSCSVVDVWNFFPDMSAPDKESVEYTNERHLLTKKQLRRLVKKSVGFSLENVRKLLRMTPKGQQEGMNQLNELRADNGLPDVRNDRRFEIWEYNGPAKAYLLELLGARVEEEIDPLQDLEVVIWHINGMVIKVNKPVFIGEDESLYSILNWEQDDSSLFGYGVPFQMRDSSRVMNASWRMIVNNGGLSAIPQVVIDKTAIQPENGKWEFKPGKVWTVTKPKTSIKEAFQTFEIPNNQQQLEAVFNMARRFADEETSLPQMQMSNLTEQGQQPLAMKTMGGMSMWLAANNIMLQKVVKAFDDDITVPIITRMYNFNMRYDNDDEIKGDFNVDARGVSVLLAQEIHAQNVSTLVSVAAALPGGLEELGTREILQKTAKALRLSEKDTLVQKQDDADKPQEIPPELQIAQMSLQEKQIEAEVTMRKEQMQYDIAMAKMAQDNDLKVAEMLSKIELEDRSRAWDSEKFFTEINIKREMGAGI